MVSKIPVMLSFDPTKIIGTATIDRDGDLIILVDGGALVREVEQLITVGMVKGISVDVAFDVAERK